MKKKGIVKLIASLIVVGLFLTPVNAEKTANKKNIWWKNSICYEIYIRSFNDSNGDGIGDINGITKKLDYLEGLGVNVLWITPFYPSGGVDMGYDISNYYGIDPKFGNLKDFENLLEEAHKRGIKIQIDMVFSHTSDQHPWFKEAKKAKNDPYHDYYVWSDNKEGNLPNGWKSWFFGPAWSYNKPTKEYYLHIFAKQQPALNWKNPKVRKAISDVAKFWMNKGVDGFRFDVITLTALPELNQSDAMFGRMPKVHDYLKELNKNVLSKYNILTVGEMPGVTYKNASDYVGKNAKQLDTIFQLDITGLGHKGNKFNVIPYSLLDFKKIYRDWYNNLYGKGWNSTVLGNHDQARAVTRWGNDTKYWKESAKMLITFQLTQWGIPYIYQGDEIGMTNCPFTRTEFRDVEAINFYNQQIKEGKKEVDFFPGLLERNRDNARTPIQWNSDKNAGFSSADKTWIKVNPNYTKINVKEQETDKDSILNYYKKMIKIRKSTPALTYGTYKEVDKNNKEVFSYIRNYKGKSFLIVVNFKGGNIEFNTSVKELNNKTVLIHNYKEAPNAFSNGIVELKPYEAVVYKL
jgi:oligo-1,6-glucosidase